MSEVKNIIEFEKAKENMKKNISDGEINALFMGLLKIIKRTAYQNANSQILQDCIMANENFRQTLKELQQTQISLKKEQEEKLNLLNIVEKQKEQICNLVKKLQSCN